MSSLDDYSIQDLEEICRSINKFPRRGKLSNEMYKKILITRIRNCNKGSGSFDKSSCRTRKTNKKRFRDGHNTIDVLTRDFVN